MWIATDSKIINFGDSWRDYMSIPETNDAVLGEDDPGGTPISIPAMASATAQTLAYIESNLQFIRNIFIFEDVTLTVTDIASWQVALNFLDKVTFVQKDVTLAIEVAAGLYAWPNTGSEARAPINIENIHGPGGIVYDVAGVTIEGDADSNRPLLNVYNSTCNIVISGAVILKNTAASGVKAASIYNVRQFTALDLDIRNDTSDTLLTAIYFREVDYAQLGLTINTNAPTDTGVGRAIFARVNSKILIADGDLTLGKLTNELFHLEKNSELILDMFDGTLPSGEYMTGLTARGVVSIDSTSKIGAYEYSSSGTGIKEDPYVITIPWESVTDTPLLIQNTLDTLPRNLNVWIKLKLPAGNMDDPVYIENFIGDGGITLEGGTTLSSRGITQTTGIDNNTETLIINNCLVFVKIDSLRLENTTGEGAIHIINSNQVEIEYCWLRAPTGGGTPDFGNGVFAIGIVTNVYVRETIAGSCNQMGVHAYKGATIYTRNNHYQDVSNRPAQYGQFAEYCGLVFHSATASEYIPGAVGTSAEYKGGRVFSS